MHCSTQSVSPMKTIKRIIACWFLVALLSPAIAQEIPSDTTFQPDPKLSADDKVTLEHAGIDNPSKPDPWTPDPREDASLLPTEKDFGESNARPVSAFEPDIKLIHKEPVETSLQNETHQVIQTKPPPQQQEQPAGNAPEKETMKRNTDGPNTQPPGQQPEAETHILQKTGPNTQPAGEQPKK